MADITTEAKKSTITQTKKVQLKNYKTNEHYVHLVFRGATAGTLACSSNVRGSSSFQPSLLSCLLWAIACFVAL